MGATRVLRIFRIGALGLLGAACSTLLGIDEDYRLSEESGGAAGTAGAGGQDGSPPVVAQCAEFANAVCTHRRACCDTVYPDWDETWHASCLQRFVELCSAAAERVPEKATYHPEMWTECQKSLAVPAKCLVDFVEALDQVGSLSACYKLITGTVGPGQACESGTDCLLVSAPGKALVCVAGSCALRGKLGPNDPCSVGTVACGPGLYCQGSPGATGKCAPVVPIGQACTAPNECGPGAYCDGTTLKCAEGIPVGSSCEPPKSCANSVCVAGKCTRVPAFAKDACQGFAIY
ncbi:MAG: hypothetical protein IT377_09305 [Polyangiaceae bacterium]|nr:hypothetical protein [Polyangiaceae bacterium]